MTITLQSHADGWLIPIRAQPNARKTAVLGEHQGAIKIAVAAPPEDGRANKALLDTLRAALKLKRSQIELHVGATSRDKKFLVHGIPRAELEQRLATLAARHRTEYHHVPSE